MNTPTAYCAWLCDTKMQGQGSHHNVNVSYAQHQKYLVAEEKKRLKCMEPETS